MNIIYFYTGNRFGGVEKLLVDLFDYQSVLSPGKIEAVFLLCYEGYLSNQLRERGALVEVIPTPHLNQPWTLVPTFFRLRKILKKYNAQVIVSHEIWNHVVAWPIEKLLSVKGVLWIHSSGFRFNETLYKNLNFWQPDFAICTSRHVRDTVLKLWPSLKADFLYHPYAKPKLKAKSKDPNQPLTLIYVGRMVEYKGLGHIIEALGLIKDLNFRCLVVGEAQTESQEDFKQNNIKKARELGVLQKVDFLGFQENVFDCLLTADVFVHPNRLPEPLGLVFMEALFAEIPVVATNIGGAKEILGIQTSKMGDLVPPDDIAALAAVLRKYIEDDDYRLKITDNIKRDFVNSFAPDTSMKKLSDILHSL